MKLTRIIVPTVALFAVFSGFSAVADVFTAASIDSFDTVSGEVETNPPVEFYESHISGNANWNDITSGSVTGLDGNAIPYDVSASASQNISVDIASGDLSGTLSASALSLYAGGSVDLYGDADYIADFSLTTRATYSFTSSLVADGSTSLNFLFFDVTRFRYIFVGFTPSSGGTLEPGSYELILEPTAHGIIDESSGGSSGGQITLNFNLSVTPVPEPATIAMMGLGGAFMLLTRCKRRID